MKDEDTLYDDDPKKHPDVRGIETADVDEIRTMNGPACLVEPITSDVGTRPYFEA